MIWGYHYFRKHPFILTSTQNDTYRLLKKNDHIFMNPYPLKLKKLASIDVSGLARFGKSQASKFWQMACLPPFFFKSGYINHEISNHDVSKKTLEHPLLQRKNHLIFTFPMGNTFFRNLSPATAPKSPSFPQPYQLSIALQPGQDRCLSTSLPWFWISASFWPVSSWILGRIPNW